MSVIMFIQISLFLFRLENGCWLNLVVKSIFGSSIKKCYNYSLVFYAMLMYFAVLFLRRKSLEYV